MDPTISYMIHNAYALQQSDSLIDQIAGFLPIAFTGLSSILIFKLILTLLFKLIFRPKKVIVVPHIDYEMQKIQQNFNPNVQATINGVADKNYTSMTTERMIELSGGWQHGDRAKFDQAMFSHDVDTVKSMISSGRVPTDYQARFSQKISSL